MIAAHAYGRRAYWLKASDLPLGDDFKFRDYWASIGHADYEPVLLDKKVKRKNCERVSHKSARKAVHDRDNLRYP